MTAKRILEIIDQEQAKYEQIANEYSKRVLNVTNGGHDVLSLESLNHYADMMEHRIEAIANVKRIIYHEQAKEKKQSA